MRNLIVGMCLLGASHLALGAGLRGQELVEIAYDIAFQRVSEAQVLERLGPEEGHGLWVFVTGSVHHNPRAMDALDWKRLAILAEDHDWGAGNLMTVVTHHLSKSRRNAPMTSAFYARERAASGRLPRFLSLEAATAVRRRFERSVKWGEITPRTHLLQSRTQQWIQVDLPEEASADFLPAKFEGFDVRVSRIAEAGEQTPKDRS